MLKSTGDRFRTLVCVVALVMLLTAAGEKTSIDAFLAKPAIEKVKLITSIADQDSSFYAPPKTSEIRRPFHDKAQGYNISLGVLEVNSMAKSLAKSPDPRTPDIDTLVDKYIISKFGVPPVVSDPRRRTIRHKGVFAIETAV